MKYVTHQTSRSLFNMWVQVVSDVKMRNISQEDECFLCKAYAAHLAIYPARCGSAGQAPG